jgi:hypothetical protein
MAMKSNPLIHAVNPGESMGRLYWQKTVTGRRPLSSGWNLSIEERAAWSCYQRYLRWRNNMSRLHIMRRAFATGVTFLMLGWAAAPALACLLPERSMTAAEHACCKQMPKMCGAANMPQSHSCCQTTTVPDRLPAMKSSPLDGGSKYAGLIHVDALPLNQAVATMAELGSPPWVVEIHSPPVSPPVTVSVLRI